MNSTRAGSPCHVTSCLITAILLVQVGYGLIYLLSPYDLAWHISSSIDRLLLQCWPATVFTTALFFPTSQDNPECLFRFR